MIFDSFVDALTDPFREPAECRIRVQGVELLELYPLVREVTVDMKRNAATTGTLVLDTFRDEKGSWRAQDLQLIRPWNKIQLLAAFGSRTAEVMRGYIKDVRAEYPEDMSGATVTITVQDESILFDRIHVEQSWASREKPITDAELVAKIVGNDLVVQAMPGLVNESLNTDSTAISILSDRAEANGYEIYFREGAIYFGPPQLEGSPQAPILVYAGPSTNCLKFDVSFDGHKPDQVQISYAKEGSGQVSGSAADKPVFKAKQRLLGDRKASSEDMGLPDFVWKLGRPTGGSADELRARAQAKANESAWKIVAEGELDGSMYGHVLLTHRTVTVDGVGENYGGLYFVDQVRHVFNSQGYRQGFRLLKNGLGSGPIPLPSLSASQVRSLW